MNWAAFAVIVDSVVTIAIGILLKNAVNRAGEKAEQAITEAGTELVKNAPEILSQALEKDGSDG